MKVSWKSVVRPVLGFVVAVVALYFVGRPLFDGLPALREQIRSPGPGFWLGAAVLLLWPLWQPLQWTMLIRGLGSSVGYREAASVLWTSNLGRYIPGKFWFVAGRWALAPRLGMGRVAESVLWELMGAASAAVLLGVGFGAVAFPGRWNLLLGVAALGTLVPVVHPRFVLTVLRTPLRWVGREVEPATSMTSAHYGTSLAAAMASFLTVGTSLSIMMTQLGTPVGIGTATAAFTLSWLGGLLAVVVPAGVGVREALLAALLAGVMSPEEAALMAVLSRVALTVMEMVAFAVGAVLWRLAPPE